MPRYLPACAAVGMRTRPRVNCALICFFVSNHDDAPSGVVEAPAVQLLQGRQLRVTPDKQIQFGIWPDHGTPTKARIMDKLVFS
jgi:hypothetical protein